MNSAKAMTLAGVLLFVAAILLPALWTDTARAAENTDQVLDDAINQGQSGGPGGGFGPYVQPATPEGPGSVTGLVVGTNCWLSRGLEGDKYRDSAVACARNGTPLAILTDDGWLVYPFTVGTNGSAKPDLQLLMPYAEQRVTATGLVVGRGMTRGIIVDSLAVAKTTSAPRQFKAKQVPNATVDGRVVDLSCWLEKGNPGTSDSTCMGVCAAGGDPLVIVARNGWVYYPVSMSMPQSPVGAAALSKYCAQTVRATGTVIARGNSRAILINKVVAYPVK